MMLQVHETKVEAALFESIHCYQFLGDTPSQSQEPPIDMAPPKIRLAQWAVTLKLRRVSLRAMATSAGRIRLLFPISAPDEPSVVAPRHWPVYD